MQIWMKNGEIKKKKKSHSLNIAFLNQKVILLINRPHFPFISKYEKAIKKKKTRKRT